MSNTELIRELRTLTSAGMKDCKEALEEAGWDLQKAVDIVKVKGLNIADGRAGRVASEGRVVTMPALAIFDETGNRLPNRELIVMVEVNCQTDFVANSLLFVEFAEATAATFLLSLLRGEHFDSSSVEQGENGRLALISSTKENIVVRRWWAEEAQHPTVKVFDYVHSNNKIGVLISMQAPTEEAANSPEFQALGEDLAMQICAMNPLAVSADRISPDEVARQKAIFETQLKEENKPEKMWEKIIEGKFRKWNTEVCLLEQESVVIPKTTVKQVIKNVGSKLGGEIQVVNFFRCQVGSGIEKKQDNLAEEVAKMM
jgi:elongation factor Ts